MICFKTYLYIPSFRKHMNSAHPEVTDYQIPEVQVPNNNNDNNALISKLPIFSICKILKTDGAKNSLKLLKSSFLDSQFNKVLVNDKIYNGAKEETKNSKEIILTEDNRNKFVEKNITRDMNIYQINQLIEKDVSII